MIPEIINKTLNRTSHDVGDIEVLCTFFKCIHEDVEGKEWAESICKVADLTKNIKAANDSISFLEEAYNAFKEPYHRLFSFRAEILKKLCLMCIENGDKAKSMDYARKFMYCLLATVAKEDRDYNQSYFSFRSFGEYSLKGIEQEKISVANPRNFNDPMDTYLYWWLDNRIKKIPSGDSALDEFYILLRKVAGHIKMRCLISSQDIGTIRSIDDMSVLMWSHYSKDHTGFCVEYNLPHILFEPIGRDEKKLLLLKNIEYRSLDIKGEPTISQALFVKAEEWKYEKEIRLVLFNQEEDDIEFPEISCKGLIKAIYLGVKCTDTDRLKMEKAIGDKCIPLFQMEIDEEHAGKFKHIRIG